jgi:hypothetical protein
MIYLQASEINTYCNIPGVDENIVAYASTLIDSYIGDPEAKQYVEQITPNKKNRGKLKHLPIASINTLEAISKTPFGITYETLSVNDIYVDEYGYFEYIPGNSLNTLMFGVMPKALKITYTAGYASPPEDLKRACAMIAMQAKKRGFDPLKSISDLDVKLEFTQNSVITDDVRLILNKYKGV